MGMGLSEVSKKQTSNRHLQTSKMDKSLALVRLARKNPWVMQQVRQMGGGALPAGGKTQKELAHINKTHMDYWPVPAGDWKEYYDKKNKTYNMQLLGGALFFLISLGFGLKDGALDYRWEPPQTNPPPKEWFNEDGTWKVMNYDLAEVSEVINRNHVFQAGEVPRLK